MKIDIHEIAKVAGGYEYFYTIFDDDGKVLLGNQTEFIGQVKPADSEVEEWKQARLDRYTREINETEPEPVMIEGSSVDQEVIEWKYAIKDIVIDEIKANPDVTESELQTKVAAKLGEVPASLTPGFIKVYTKEAFDRSLINSETFDALKQFVVGKEKSDIEAIR